MDTSFTIAPVSTKTIDNALALLQRIFKTFDEIEDPYFWFKISLAPEKNAQIIHERGCRDVRYFVVLNSNDKVIGTTGLYHLNRDPEKTVWLGFYCLEPEYRGKGIGKQVLSWTIEKAQTEGNTIMKLYTSPNEDLTTAQEIYDKFGFITTETEEKNGETVIYKELNLEK